MVGEYDMNKLVSKSGYRTYIYLIPNVVVIIIKHHFQEINPTNSTNDNVMSSVWSFKYKIATGCQ